MKSIWKYVIRTTDEQRIEMPLDSEILAVQIQLREPVIWCLIDMDAKKAFRKLHTFGTGHLIKNNYTGKYIGTYQVCDGLGAFHLFDYGYE